MTDYILAFTENIPGAYGYLILALCACVENIVPPLPGDTVAVFGGYLTGIGRLNIYGVITATTSGSFAGFMLMFYLGRVLGKRYFINSTRFMSGDTFSKITVWFQRFGYTVILCNRFLSGARSVISVCAGITNMNAGRVALYALASCLAWNLMLVGAGHEVGENWELVSRLLQKYNRAVLAAVIMIAAAVTLKALRNRSGRYPPAQKKVEESEMKRDNT